MTQMTSHRLTFGEALRASGAVLALLVIVVGIPIALVIVTPSLTDVGQLRSLLTRPDDGTLFLDVLAAIAWIAWACFAISVLVEIFAVVRGLPTPRLPLLGVTQRSAAALVGTAAVLLTSNPWTVSLQGTHTTAPVATFSDGPALMRAAPVAEHLPEANVRNAATAAAHHVDAGAGPSITVRHGDTLWALADRHLGAGSRYQEIAELNYGQAQPDGRTLDRAHWIYPGWTLRLPADASHLAHTESTYTVRSGDTLAEVAAEKLGDAKRYPEIVDLTKDVRQPNGARLRNPDQIHPGWTLRLPAAVADTSAPSLREDRPEVSERARVAPQPPTTHAPEPSRPAPAPSRPTSKPAPASSAAADPKTTQAAPTTSSPQSRPRLSRSMSVPAPSKSPVPTESEDRTGATSDEVDFPSRLVLGMGGLAAAGLIGQLTWRRRRQQRHRRPGERIPMPAPEEASFEQTLHAAQEPFTVQDIRRALRALAQQRYEVGLELPRLLHVRVTRSDVYLDFADDELDVPDGFIATNARTWRIGETHRRQDPDALDQGEPEDQAIDPYPVLVTLGVIEGDTLLLVNLEAAGSLSIVGDPEATRPVLLALASELTTSPLSETAAVTLGGSLQALATVHDQARVRAASDDSEIVTLVDQRQKDVCNVLAAADAPDVLAARGRRVAEDTWLADVFASDSDPVIVDPWSGMVAVGASRDFISGWNLTVNGSDIATLEPGAKRIEPQRLDGERYAHLLSLLATADAEPAQQTTEASEEQPAQNDQELEEAKPATSAAELKPPRVLVLGPVDVEGADDQAIPNRRRRATELVAYLALHPGATMHQIDEAIWPGRRVGKQTRNSFVSRARHWLGHTEAGQPYLPLVADEGHYGLHAEVGCDWHDFTRLAEASEDVNGDQDGLRQALELVRGRPFLGVNPTTYGWAEADTQDMISAIVDAAHKLAQLCIEAGDQRAAQLAASKGLLAEPFSELLYRDLIQVSLNRGDRQELDRLVQRLRAQLERVDPDGELDPETIKLLTERNER